MKVALLYSSKKAMQAALFRRPDELIDEEAEPPPDLLAECDSDETIQAVGRSLAERYQVYYVESDEKAFSRLRRIKPDLVFNIAERLWGPNRESHIPTICEMLGLPYTGSDPLTLGICLDKSRAKEILSYYGIPTPGFIVVDSLSSMPENFSLPAIVKPLHEGSSKGIKNDSVVYQRRALKDKIKEVISFYQQPAIVEQFISGREFTVGVLGNYPDFEILPIVEINYSELPPGATPIYSYEAKWLWDTPEKPLDIFECPAKLTPELKEDIEDVVLRTCTTLRIKDWCRIDIRLDGNGRPNILEINPLPGILPNPEDNSCLPKAARAAGYTYSMLIHRVVEAAAKRYGLALPGQSRPSVRHARETMDRT